MDVDETLEHAVSDRAMPPQRFASGTTIGHFRIVRELGAGGMGIVFEAYDPDLDRSVAIKVVRDRDAGSSAGLRLVREAQAMARLGHPNVVPVHEVGTIDGQVFVVMELVRGATLGTWLEATRSWREIVRAFVAAGDGLAAAHAAGLIHRDFKPSNVLVDGSGHVRVSDFGLAKQDSADAGPRFADGTDPTRPAGTPAYMAPEQKAGDDIDARADQYSFAISLDRALSADTTFGRIPRRVRAAVARALAVDPAARFATLDDLLHELRRALDARRRLVVALTAGLAVAAATTAIAAWVMRPAADDCAAGAKLVDSVWNARARDSLAQQFAAVRPAASVAIATTGKLLDDWSESWRLGRRAACHAEPAPRTARLACLDSALGELRAQLGAWSHPEPESVDRAVRAASALADPAACAHRNTGVVSEKARAIVDRAAAIKAADRAGKARSVAPEVDPLLADAAKLGDPGASAAALLAAATIRFETGDVPKARDALAEAAIDAGKAGDDVLLLDALRNEAIATTELGRPLDSLGMLDAADAVAARAGIDREWQIALVRGNDLIEAGKFPDAEHALQHAIDLLEPRAAREPSHLYDLANALAVLGTAFNEDYQFDKARPLFERSLAIEEKELGPTNPVIGKTLSDLSEAEMHLGDFDTAAAHVARSKEVFVAAYGPDHPLVGQVTISLADVARARGKLDEALALYEQARTLLEPKLPADHDAFVTIESETGAIYSERGDCKTAVVHYQRVLAIFEHRGPGGIAHGGQLVKLAECLSQLGRDKEAYDAAKQSLAELELANAAPMQLAETRVTLADLEANLGHTARALELDQAFLATTKDGVDPELTRMRTYVAGQVAKWSKQ